MSETSDMPVVDGPDDPALRDPRLLSDVVPAEGDGGDPTVSDGGSDPEPDTVA